MKKIILIATLAIFSFTSDAQKKKKLTESFGIYRDVTEIIKSGKDKIKDGLYVRSNYEKSENFIEGHFSNGARSGNWVYKSQGEVIAFGKYFEDRKVGIWEYNQAMDKVRITYDHDTDSLLTVSNAPREYEVFKNGTFQFADIDRIPVNPDFITELHETLIYPRTALRMGIEGKCLVEFIITEDGKIEDPKFIQSIGAGTEEEILRALGKVSNVFLPALKSNRPVKIKQYLLVQYNFNNLDCCTEVIWRLL